MDAVGLAYRTGVGDYANKPEIPGSRRNEACDAPRDEGPQPERRVESQSISPLSLIRTPARGAPTVTDGIRRVLDHIINDPNGWFDGPRDLITSLRRIVHVSVQTVAIVANLPGPFSRPEEHSSGARP